MANREYQSLVTKDDYLTYYGVDLDVILVGLVLNTTGDNPSGRFIADIEKWCIRKFMLPPYFWNGNIEEFNDRQKSLFIDGVCQQINYVLEKGKLSTYTFNQETNFIVPQAEMERIGMNPDARDCFKLAGISNLMVYYG